MRSVEAVRSPGATPIDRRGVRRRRTPLLFASTAVLMVAALALSACSRGAGGSGGTAMPTVTLQLEAYQQASDPWTQAAQQFADQVNKDTGGAVTIHVYPSATLVSQDGAVQAVTSGTVDMGAAAGPNLGSLAKGIDVLAAPYWITTMPQAIKIAESSEMIAAQDAALQSHGVRLLSECTDGFSQFVSKKPLTSIADFKGLKVRSPDSPREQIISALGGEPSVVALNELYEALQLNTISAAQESLGLTVSEKFYEVAKYYDELETGTGWVAMVMNKASFGKLSAKEQSIVQADGAKLTVNCENLETSLQPGEEKTLQAKGGVIVPAPSDLTPFINATASIRNATENESPLAKQLTQIKDKVLGTGSTN